MRSYAISTLSQEKRDAFEPSVTVTRSGAMDCPTDGGTLMEVSMSSGTYSSDPPVVTVGEGVSVHGGVPSTA